MPLMGWLNQRIFPVEQRLTPEIVRLGCLMGYAEMLRTGTTACVDMYLFEEAVFQAAQTAGTALAGRGGCFRLPFGGLRRTFRSLGRHPRPGGTVCGPRAFARGRESAQRLYHHAGNPQGLP